MSKSNFDPNTTKYSLENALTLGRASDCAYEKENEVEVEIKGWGYEKFRFFNKRETQAFITADNDAILVAFRGTEPTKLKDWMSDIDIDLVDGPGGKVHEGFKRALSHVWPEMRSTIDKFQDNGQSLWFTGHSLGAALATLAVANLRLEEDKPINGLYTFGSPRVGDREFAKSFNADFKFQTFRFVNNNDVVTRVPPRMLKYSHIGSFLYFKADGNLVDDIHWWNKFLDRVKGRVEDFLKPGTDGIKDHSMKRYVTNLKKNI